MTHTDFSTCHATPIKAIRAHCLGSVGYNAAVTNCTAPQCSLYPYRKGKRPEGGVLIGLTETIQISRRKA